MYLDEIFEQRSVIHFFIILHAALSQKHREEIDGRAYGGIVPGSYHHFWIHILKYTKFESNIKTTIRGESAVPI